MRSDAVLCYVKPPWAFFTTQPLKDQWGDDWDDRPYEVNAGYPYLPADSDKKKWEIVQIAYEGDFVTPDDGHLNSPWSVEDINAFRGAIAWLRSSKYSGHKVVIPAGTTLKKFIELIRKGGGKVYLEAKQRKKHVKADR